MNHKIIVSAIMLFLLNIAATPAKADREKVVNGQPCVAELCIGDDLTTLNIDWKPAKEARSSRALIPKGNMLGNPKDIQQFAPYWYSGSIDKKGVAALSKIKGFCQANPRGELRGEYINKTGKTVIVHFLLIALDNGKSQKFVANLIQTILPNTANLTVEQRTNIQLQLIKQYPGFLRSDPGNKPYVALESVFYNGGFNSAINLRSAPLNIFRSDDLFRRYPGCGSDRVIPID
jgi:hypothetical protein